MEIIQHYNKIWEIKNFLLDDEINFLIKKAKNAQEDQWKNNNLDMMDFDIHFETRIMLNTIKQRLSDYFINQDKIQDINGIHRIVENGLMGPHIDVSYNPHYKTKIMYGCVMYLNDDYIGGEINYPELKLKIKPKTRSLVIHKAKYLHEILEVKSGTRYMLTTFIHGYGNTKFIK